MTDSALAVVILAAGKGTRMKSARPKVLHAIGGKPMLAHVLDTAKVLGAARIVVVIGAGDDKVAELVRSHGAEAVVQEKALGTGHAVRAAEKTLNGFTGRLLVLFGDTPLMSAKTLAALPSGLDSGASLAALGFRPADPSGYGRMIVEEGKLKRIVEHKDANAEERAVGLCFAGPLAAPAGLIFDLLSRVEAKNAQGEYYLTDIVGLARARGLACAAAEGPAEEMLGVNSRADLAAAESVFQSRRRWELMEAGVGMIAPDTVYLSADTAIEADVMIAPYVVFGPGVTIKRGADIRGFCHIEYSEIGENCVIGPFARLRGGAKLEANADIGNFVELKNAHLEKGVKAHHLAYLGDAHVGAAANIGAGTITCNYDGVSKHRTEIGAGAFIGTNSSLVAPVSVGEGAIIAAGSVITENVEPDALALGRGRQVVKPGRAKTMRAALKAGSNESKAVLEKKT